MIPLTIAFIAAGLIVVANSVIAYRAIRDSSRFRQAADAAIAGKKALNEQNATLQQENADLSEVLEATRRIYNNLLAEHKKLKARNTALMEAMEAKPTQPKRTVRKNSTQAQQQEEA